MDVVPAQDRSPGPQLLAWLQGTHTAEGAGSASMASVPGAPVWLATLELVVNRNITSESWVKVPALLSVRCLLCAVECFGCSTRQQGQGCAACVMQGSTWQRPAQQAVTSPALCVWTPAEHPAHGARPADRCDGAHRGEAPL